MAAPLQTQGEKMFAKIKTNNATDIVIHIPTEGAEKTLPALARMLEQNAVFVRRTWREVEIVRPEMEIVLGNVLRTGHEGEPEIAVVENGSVIDDSFVLATPETLVSSHEAIATKEKLISELRNKIAVLSAENDLLRGKHEVSDE
jgi:hypothetical protein